MDDSNAGCIIGIIVLCAVIALLYVLWLVISAYWEVFLITGIVLGAVISWLSLRSRKRRKIRVEKERHEYENSSEGKFNIAIEKCVAKRHEQEKTLEELHEMLKSKLDQIYIKYHEPQPDESLIYEFKGRARCKKDVENFNSLFRDKIENEIRELQIRFPEKTDFEHKYAVTNKYEDVYFEPGYYYEGRYHEGLFEETVREVKFTIAEVQSQVSLTEKLIEYYRTLENRFKETKQNYRVSEHIKRDEPKITEISRKSLADKIDLERTKEEAEQAELVYKEYTKLTAEFSDNLTGAMQQLLKREMDGIGKDFERELK
ncbi:MAG: hypothetical protein KJ607_14780 [Bacteroidetes bacterium]|nr:hypothetical protein [Bacteroidota bacterium]